MWVNPRRWTIQWNRWPCGVGHTTWYWLENRCSTPFAGWPRWGNCLCRKWTKNTNRDNSFCIASSATVASYYFHGAWKCTIVIHTIRQLPMGRTTVRIAAMDGQSKHRQRIHQARQPKSRERIRVQTYQTTRCHRYTTTKRKWLSTCRRIIKC